VTPNFDVFGVFVVFGALTADAFVGNTQEELFKLGASLTEAVTWCSLFSCCIACVSIVVLDDVMEAVRCSVGCVLAWAPTMLLLW
jgi:hypothetical protein